MCKLYKKYLMGLLVPAILSSYACAPSMIAGAPQVIPPRLSPADSRAYTAYLEKEKRYQELLRILNRELTTLQLVELYAKKGIDLTPDEYSAISKIGKDNGLKNPVDDYLRFIRLTPEKEHNYQEGELFLTDYLAEIYTYGLVDFRRAQKYNDRALFLLKKLSGSHFKDLPLSSFYGNKRHFFYYLKCPDEKYTTDLPLYQGARQEELCGKPKIAYDFDQGTLDAVRRLDFSQVAQRVENRNAFISHKLGKTLPPANANKSNRSALSSKGLLPHVEKVIAGSNHYSEFNSYCLLASEAYQSYLRTGEKALLPAIIGYGKKALAVQPEIGLPTQNKINLVNYRIGYAMLKAGNTGKGIGHMERYIEGIDQYELLEREHDSHRKTLIAKVNREQLEAARKSAATQKALGFLTILASAAGAAMAIDAGPTGTSSAEQFINSLGDGIAVVANASQTIKDEEMQVAFRDHLARYITPYSLKVGRYLNMYEMVDYFFELGKAYHRKRNLPEAVRHYGEAIRIFELQRATILREAERISFSGSRQELYDRIISALVESGESGKALEFVERAKSRAFVDIMGTAKVALKSPYQSELFLNRLMTEAEMETMAHTQALGNDQINEMVAKAKRSIQTGPGRGTSGRSPDLDIELLSLSQVYTLTSEEMKSLVEKDTALVEYYLSENALYIFVVTPQRVRVVKKRASLRGIVEKAVSWKKNISKLKPTYRHSRYFYDLMIGPVKKAIKSKKRLIFVPHSVLHYLPFQALHDGNRFLIEKHAISYAPSATVLRMLEQKNRSGMKNAFIVGNPTGDLKFAEREALQIGKLFSKKKVLTLKKATESEFKDACGDYEFIHLATHGLYDSKRPMHSRVYLSKDSENDGLLTASELFSVQLNANLVTLSACDTGISQYKTGDELIGLQRGFMFAGTRSIISSLWKVDDKATNYLMQNLYKNMKHMPKDNALQKAQLQTMKKYSKPYFWASFNLIGTVD